MNSSDLVIMDLADTEAAALDRIADLERENGVLREMVSEALTLLARETSHLEAARRAIAALRLELRHVPVRPAA